MSGVSIKTIQDKLVAKLEEKFKNGVSVPKLGKMFKDHSVQQPGFLSLAEFQHALELNGNALSANESAFLFDFWDTLAGQQDGQGFVEVSLVVQDIFNSVPEYSTGFKSGDDGFKNKGAKGNMPSQEGGIFGGGAYSADAMGGYAVKKGVYVPETGAAAEYNRPKYSNQSSVEGGIFGEGACPPLVPASNGKSNRSNQSSIAGGIFGEAPPIVIPTHQKKNSNQSSIPGGIFG